MRFVVPVDAISWVDYDADSYFPIQNIPFGAFLAVGETEPRPCTAIGEYVVDLALLEEAGLIVNCGFQPGPKPLDILIRRGSQAITDLRQRLYELFHEDNESLQTDEDLQSQAFLLQEDVAMVSAFSVGAFVDFYSGIHHASNVGRMFRPDQPPLLPNYRWLPIGYNGRASSVVVSGTPIRRPWGQVKGPDDPAPRFAPSRRFDIELELGLGSAVGPPLAGAIIDAGGYGPAIAGSLLIGLASFAAVLPVRLRG